MGTVSLTYKTLTGVGFHFVVTVDGQVTLTHLRFKTKLDSFPSFGSWSVVYKRIEVIRYLLHPLGLFDAFRVLLIPHSDVMRSHSSDVLGF